MYPFFQHLIDNNIRRNRTVSVESDVEDNILFRSLAGGPKVPTFEQARNTSKVAGLSEVFDFSKPGFSQQSGTQHRGWVRDLQKKLGPDAKVGFETWQLTEGNFDDFVSSRQVEGGGFGGFFSTDGDTARVLTAEIGGKTYTHDEILELLGEKKGLFAKGSGKTGKRLGGLLNPTQYSATTPGPIGAMIFDPSDVTDLNLKNILGAQLNKLTQLEKNSLLHGGERTKAHSMAFDGMMVINPRRVDDFIDDSRLRIVEDLSPYAKVNADMSVEELTKAIKKIKPTNIDEASMVNTALKTLKEAQELKEGARTGKGVYNWRGYNIESVDESVEVKGIAGDRLGGKGNVKFGNQRLFDIWEKIFGTKDEVTGEIIPKKIHVAGSVDNFFREAGMAGDESFQTLDSRKGSGLKEVFLDVDTMVTHQNIYNPDDVIEYNKQLLETALTDIREGRIPEKFANMLENFVPDVMPDELVQRLVTQEKAGWMAGLSLMDQYGLDIRDNPAAMRQLISQYPSQLFKDGTIPKLALPQTSRGEVYSKGLRSLMAEKGKGINIKDIKEGYLNTVGDEFILANEDIYKFYESFGGFDQDDALVSMLRYDEKAGGLKAITYRQPTGVGEVAVLDVDADSDFIDMQLKKMDSEVAETFAERRGLVREQLSEGLIDATEARETMEELTETYGKQVFLKQDTDRVLYESLSWSRLQKTPQGMEVAKAVIERNPEWTMEGGGMPEYFRHHIAFEEKIKDAMEISEAKLASEGFGEKAVLAQAKEAAKTRGQLGEYTNARMLVAGAINDNRELLGNIEFQADDLIEVLRGETVIDASISMDSLTGSAQLSKAKDDLLRQFGGFLRKAHDKKEDIFLDATFFGEKAKNPRVAQMINEGLGDGVEIAELLQNKGRYHEFVTRTNDELVTPLSDELAKLSKVNSFGEAIDTSLFSEEAVSDARGMLDFARERMRQAGDLAQSETDDIISDIFKQFDPGIRKTAAYDAAHRDILGEAGKWADTFKPQEVHERIAAAAQIVGTEKEYKSMGHIFNKSLYGHDITDGVRRKTGIDMNYMLQAAQAHVTTKASESGRLPLDSETYTKRSNLVAEADIRYRTGEITRGASQRIYPGMDRYHGLAKAAADAKIKLKSGSENAYSQIKKLYTSEGARELVGKRGFKRAAIGAAALTGFSVLYQRLKHGRSEDDFEGPSLPGGSAYEYSAPPQMSSPNPGSGTQGLSKNYRVTVGSGNNMNEVMDGISGLTNGSVNGTIYDRKQGNQSKSYSQAAREQY